MEPGLEFWQKLDALASRSEVIIDRPRGSRHPRHASLVYPLDYGYLEGTRSGDAGGIDVWVGSLANRDVSGIICTIDAERQDAEIKVLLGCTDDEAAQALAAHNCGQQRGLLILHPLRPWRRELTNCT